MVERAIDGLPPGAASLQLNKPRPDPIPLKDPVSYRFFDGAFGRDREGHFDRAGSAEIHERPRANGLDSVHHGGRAIGGWGGLGLSGGGGDGQEGRRDEGGAIQAMLDGRGCWLGIGRSP